MNDTEREINRLISQSESELKSVFDRIGQIEETRTGMVLDSFRKNQVSYRHFTPSTGYGYGDIARETLEKVFADIFHTEAAIVRPHIASGTSALSLTLFGLTRPGEKIVSATGLPYDTLLGVIGIGQDSSPRGSLIDNGREFEYAELNNGQIDIDAVERLITPNTSLIIAQRSRGYSWRRSLMPEDFQGLADMIRERHPGILLMVDNCYGEFVSEAEPTDFGADICVGSLIKNPGGGIAPTGGYIAGSAEAVDRVAGLMTAPGLGREIGSYSGDYRLFYQGLFMAPHTVAQALRTAALIARTFEKLGYETVPGSEAQRADIVQAIKLKTGDNLISFCQGIQRVSPVDSMVLPEPWDMPGYQDPVIMAAGTFVAGASIELSADGPMRPPYTVYFQGSLTYAHGKLCLKEILKRIMRKEPEG